MNGSRSLSRQEVIVGYLLEEQSIGVGDLAKRLAVSTWTVRRDLTALEQRGLVKRRYGAAAIVDGHPYDSFRPNAANGVGTEVKRRIGLAAARLVQPGQSVAIGAGTTTFAVAQALRERGTHCHVVTNTLEIAAHLGESPRLHVTCSGGDVQGRYGTLTGPVAERALASHFFDIAFIGVTGIGAQQGVTVNSQLNAAVYRGMMAQCKRVVLVADHTKFDRVRFAYLAPLSSFDGLITDRTPPPACRAALEAAMVDVYVVGPEIHEGAPR